MLSKRSESPLLCAACLFIFGTGKLITWLASNIPGFDPKLREGLTSWVQDACARSIDDLEICGALVVGDALIVRRNRESMCQASVDRCAICTWLLLEYLYRMDFLNGNDMFLRFRVGWFERPGHAVPIEAAYAPTTISIENVVCQPGGNWEATIHHRVHHFGITAHLENPAAAVIHTEPVARGSQVNTPYAFRKIRARLEECMNEHPTCLATEPRRLPYRVIDVGHSDNDVRLFESSGHIAPYTALSYIWGMESQPVMTTEKTLSRFILNVPVVKLAQTLRDAITVTRNIGVRYLWADSLCIVQDSNLDKDNQIAEIPHIFRFAHVTIYAAHAKSCADGFLKHNHDSYTSDRGFYGFRDLAIPFICPDDLQGQVILQPHPVVDFHPDEEPIATRAWTLEERLLSQRILIYADGVIMWQCHAGLFDVPGPRHPRDMTESGQLRANFTMLDEYLLTVNPVSSNPFPLARIAELKETWLHIVCDYVHRRLSRPLDRLRAISGLASRFQHAFTNYQYLAGVWYSPDESREVFLTTQLLWNRNDTPPDPKVLALADQTAPSWSWASVSGGIGFGRRSDPRTRLIPKANTRVCTADVVHFDTTPISPANPYGAVHGGRLTIKCPCQIAPAHKDGDRRFTEPRPQVVDEIEHDLPFFRMELDRRPVEPPAGQIVVWYARIVTTGGLLLSPNADGTFRRVGSFWEWGDGVEISSFFEKSSIMEVTIV